MLNSHIRQYICKNTKNIQKSDFMDGFCLQGELDLTLFYKIEGCFDNLKSLMTLNDTDLNDTETTALLMISEVSGRFLLP